MATAHTIIDPPEDHDVLPEDRNRSTRRLSAILAASTVMFSPALFGSFVGGSIFGPAGSWLFGVVGFGVGGYLLSNVVNRFFVYNEEGSAYVPNDAIWGKNIPYGPGFHLSHFWEERNKDGNYKLEIATKTFEVSVQTTTANVTVTGSFQWRIDLALINRFIGINPSTVENGLLAFIKSFLTEELAKKDAEHARTTVSYTHLTLPTNREV